MLKKKQKQKQLRVWCKAALILMENFKIFSKPCRERHTKFVASFYEPTFFFL